MVALVWSPSPARSDHVKPGDVAVPRPPELQGRVSAMMRVTSCRAEAPSSASNYREFGPPDDPGLVFFLGQGLLEVSGHAVGPPGRSVMIWI
jgi:hypothetical protein